MENSIYEGVQYRREEGSLTCSSKALIFQAETNTGSRRMWRWTRLTTDINCVDEGRSQFLVVVTTTEETLCFRLQSSEDCQLLKLEMERRVLIVEATERRASMDASGRSLLEELNASSGSLLGSSSRRRSSFGSRSGRDSSHRRKSERRSSSRSHHGNRSRPSQRSSDRSISAGSSRDHQGASRPAHKDSSHRRNSDASRVSLDSHLRLSSQRSNRRLSGGSSRDHQVSSHKAQKNSSRRRHSDASRVSIDSHLLQGSQRSHRRISGGSSRDHKAQKNSSRRRHSDASRASLDSHLRRGTHTRSSGNKHNRRGSHTSTGSHRHRVPKSIRVEDDDVSVDDTTIDSSYSSLQASLRLSHRSYPSSGQNDYPSQRDGSFHSKNKRPSLQIDHCVPEQAVGVLTKLLSARGSDLMGDHSSKRSSTTFKRENSGRFVTLGPQKIVPLLQLGENNAVGSRESFSEALGEVKFDPGIIQQALHDLMPVAKDQNQQPAVAPKKIHVVDHCVDEKVVGVLTGLLGKEKFGHKESRSELQKMVGKLIANEMADCDGLDRLLMDALRNGNDSEAELCFEGMDQLLGGEASSNSQLS